MLAAPKAFEIVGGEPAVTVAVLLVAPVPPLVERPAPVVLFFTPLVVPVTLRPIVQLPPVAIVPPVKLTLPVPAVAVIVPPQVLLRLVGVATTRPDGKASLKATPFSATVA